jgi:hypothetical protein
MSSSVVETLHFLCCSVLEYPTSKFIVSKHNGNDGNDFDIVDLLPNDRESEEVAMIFVTSSFPGIAEKRK